MSAAILAEFWPILAAWVAILWTLIHPCRRSDGGDVIEAEHFGGLDLGIRHGFVIENALQIRHSKNVRGKHHCDRHEGTMVRLLSAKNREDSFTTRHTMHA